MAKAKEPKEEKQEKGAASQLKKYFENHKEDHYNFEPDYSYRVKSGSLILDSEVSMGPGVARFIGSTSGGKTSCTLAYMKNFLADSEYGHNRVGVYFKSEGRLGEEMQERSGIEFFKDPRALEEGDPFGKCFIIESNVYEFNFGLVRDLITDNPNNTQYFFVFDSADAMGRREDLAKPLEKADQVAGGALITSVFLKKAALALAKRGHIAVFISQNRQAFSATPYTPQADRQGKASGGLSVQHYTDLALEFLRRSKDDIIYDDSPQLTKTKGKKILGHWCKVKVWKSNNEKYQTELTYPIRYGRKDGKSVWQEYEITDTLLMFEQIKRSGGWFNFSDLFRQDLLDAGFDEGDVPEKLQGIDKVRDFFRDNEKIREYVYQKLLTLIGD